jgi:hypothetical protein
MCKIGSLSCASKWEGIAWSSDNATESCWRWCCGVGASRCVMTPRSHAGDDDVKSCWRWHCRIGVGCGVMSLPSLADDGTAESSWRWHCLVMPRGCCMGCWPSGCNYQPSRCRCRLSTTEVPPLTVRESMPTVRVLAPTDWVRLMIIGVLSILQRWGQKRLSLRDVLIVEVIDLNTWIFTPAHDGRQLSWFMTMIYYRGGCEIERTLITQETQWFLDRSLRPVFCCIIICWCCGYSWRVPRPSFYIQSRGGYKESTWVGYNCSPSTTLSLIFSKYKIWSYPNRTLPLGDILPSSCWSVGLCRSLWDSTESSCLGTLGMYPRHLYSYILSCYMCSHI